MIDIDKLAALEGLLFVVGDEGLSLLQVEEILEVNEIDAKALINELKKSYDQKDRGIRIHFLGNTFKLTTKNEHKKYYEKLLVNEENNKLSNTALETLAIVAYNEPITRVQVDEIRGVYSGFMIRKLVAKGLLKECEKSNLPGKPILYKTTKEFLDYFGLSDINELPKIEKKIESVDNIDLYKSKYSEEIID